MWTAVLLGSLGCYLLKLLGLSVPERVLANARLRHVAVLLPVALLAALAAIETFSDGEQLAVDARAAGIAVAVLALLLRAPFLVVVGAAAVTAALLRLLT